MSYQEFTSSIGAEFIIKNGNTFIPKSEENTDYQEYLAWLAEGNEPLPPDEPEGQTA